MGSCAGCAGSFARLALSLDLAFVLPGGCHEGKCDSIIAMEPQYGPVALFALGATPL